MPVNSVARLGEQVQLLQCARWNDRPFCSSRFMAGRFAAAHAGSSMNGTEVCWSVIRKTMFGFFGRSDRAIWDLGVGCVAVKRLNKSEPGCPDVIQRLIQKTVSSVLRRKVPN